MTTRPTFDIRVHPEGDRWRVFIEAIQASVSTEHRDLVELTARDAIAVLSKMDYDSFDLNVEYVDHPYKE